MATGASSVPRFLVAPPSCGATGHERAKRHGPMSGPGPDGELGPADADITDPDTYVDGVPHATFLRLRTDDPVSWWDERGRIGVLGGHPLRRPALGESQRRGVLLGSGHPPRGDGPRRDRGAADDDGARSARAHGLPPPRLEAVQPTRGLRLRAGDPRAGADGRSTRRSSRRSSTSSIASPSSCRCACWERCWACPRATVRGSSSSAMRCSATPIPSSRRIPSTSSTPRSSA